MDALIASLPILMLVVAMLNPLGTVPVARIRWGKPRCHTLGTVPIAMRVFTKMRGFSASYLT